MPLSSPLKPRGSTPDANSARVPVPTNKVGDRVFVQNQTGPHPNRWDNTGTVIEVKQFDQYGIRMDSSGRCTLRNRKFLRKYISEDPYHQPFTMERKTREATNPPQTEDPKDSQPPNDNAVQDPRNSQPPNDNTVEDTTMKTPDTEDATAEPTETIENIQEKKIPAEQTEESEPR